MRGAGPQRPLPGNIIGTLLVCIAGAIAGALWIMLAGWLRQYRGINETISSLLLAYIAIGVFKHIVEGPLRDPASLNKPSTFPLGDGLLIGWHARLWTCTGGWPSAWSPASGWGSGCA